MIVVDQNAGEGRVRILARGNFSLSGAGLLSVIALLGLVTLALSAILAWQGFWPVLLIAIVQLGLVFWLLIKAWYAAWVVERIEIDAKRTVIIRQHQYGQRSWEMDTRWVRVWLEKPDIRWYLPRLSLRSHGREVELGSFLNKAEKQELAGYLQNTLAQYSAWCEQKLFS